MWCMRQMQISQFWASRKRLRQLEAWLQRYGNQCIGEYSRWKIPRATYPNRDSPVLVFSPRL